MRENAVRNFLFQESEPIRVKSCNRTFPSSFFIILGLLQMAHSVFGAGGSLSLFHQYPFQMFDDPFCRLAVPFRRDGAFFPPAYAEASAGFAKDTSGTTAARPS